ncbi:MAG TPA: plastocyanin/azurin family copper-binding protein [Vicinamibacterales bacterium]|nr:plastocyanin/azurin family copper-binding protein [Vicinamibacterales bacterium]
MPSSVLALILVAAVSVAAPGVQKPAPKPASGPRVVDISGDDTMKYSITTITARPGERLRIRLTSKGTLPKIAMAHNVVVLKLGTNVEKFVTDGAAFRASDFIAPAHASEVIAKTTFAGPGETVQVTFTVPSAPGRYPFLCTFSGHYQAGMKGTLVVK